MLSPSSRTTSVCRRPTVATVSAKASVRERAWKKACSISPGSCAEYRDLWTCCCGPGYWEAESSAPTIRSCRAAARSHPSYGRHPRSCRRTRRWVCLPAPASWSESACLPPPVSWLESPPLVSWLGSTPLVSWLGSSLPGAPQGMTVLSPVLWKPSDLSLCACPPCREICRRSVLRRAPGCPLCIPLCIPRQRPRGSRDYTRCYIRGGIRVGSLPDPTIRRSRAFRSSR